MRISDWIIGALIGILVLFFIFSSKIPVQKIETYQKTDLGILMNHKVYPIVIINYKEQNLTDLPPFNPIIKAEDLAD